jgi:hypothetical protein
MKHTIPRKYFKVLNIPYFALYLRALGSIAHNLMRVLWRIDATKELCTAEILISSHQSFMSKHTTASRH